jgi:transaldolase
MAVYLDSAHPDDAHGARALRFVAGITTNPILVSRTGQPGMEVLGALLGLTDGPVFYQVTAPDAAGCLAQARAASALAPGRVVIKVPASTPNFMLAAAILSEGMRVCVTAVSAPAQAYLAAMLGADFIAVYVNRLTRQTGDGLAIVRGCRAALQGAETRLLAASLKSADEVMDSVFSGAHDVTMPLAIIEALGNHPLSAAAIAEFAGYTHP